MDRVRLYLGKDLGLIQVGGVACGRVMGCTPRVCCV